MSDSRTDLPSPNAPNFEQRVREALMTYMGRTGNPMDRGLTLRDLLDNGLVTLPAGYTLRPGGQLPPLVPGDSISTPELDFTPPPQPTGFQVASALTHVFIEHDAPLYLQGGGHLRTHVYGVTMNPGDPLPVFGDAVEITQFSGTVHAHPSNPATTWRLWIKWETAAGVLSPTPAGGTNGLLVSTGLVGTSDLSDQIITAAKIADGSVNLGGSKITGLLANANMAVITDPTKIADSLISNTKLADLAVTAGKLASGAVSLTKFASGIEPVAVATGALPTTKSTEALVFGGKLYRWSGTAYVATVPTTDLSGTVTDAQIAGLAAAKVTGTLVSSQIADAAITTAKFASGIEPVEIVSALPTTGNFAGRIAFLTTDNKLYRHTGSAWVSSVASSDISGTITDAQIAGLAASKVTGQLTNTQIADLAAAKVTGQIAGTQITNGAISTAKLAAGSVTAATIAADTITASQIAANAITSAELAAGAVVAGKIAAGVITATEIAASTITGSKIAASTITASNIAADTITAGQIAAGAISASEIATGAVTTAKLAAGAVTANEIAAATITGGKIAAGTITGSNIAADTITAGQIAAGAISTSEIAAGAITTDKLLVTGGGPAINDDPNTQDLSAWSGGGLSIIDDTTSPVGSKALRCAATGSAVLSRRVPLDAAKNYQLRMWTRQETGASTTYLTVAFYNAAGAVISGGASGWPFQGTYNYFGLNNGALPAPWTEYRISFGPGETAKIPSSARFVSVGVLSNYTGSGTQLVAGVRLMLKSDADLIVNGAITAGKIATGAIVANDGVIANAAITNALIANLAVGSAQIVDAAITSVKIGTAAVGSAAIQDLAVTNAKIANLAVDSAKIASLTADKITAGSIAVGQHIQSASYVAGSAGWRIEGGGTAEFSNVTVRGNVTSSTITGGTITGAVITGGTFQTASSGQRVSIDTSGILFLTGTASGKYGTFKRGTARKYGSGVLTYFNNSAKRVPFYMAAEQNVADIHLYNRGADPTGATYEAGDMICVNGRLKIYVPALGGWRTLALDP